MVKVLSFSLFLNKHIGNIKFLKYLYGLMCNVIRAKTFLSNWEIRIYVEENIFTDNKYILCANILRHCEILNDKVRIIQISNNGATEEERNFNHLMDRFKPICDSEVEFLVVRDADSIIGILDIFFIKIFSRLKERIFCCYREKNMGSIQSMGGGFSCNCKLYRENYSSEIKWFSELDQWKYILNYGLYSGRSEIWYKDETILHYMLIKVSKKERLLIPVRMKEDGGYYLYYDENSKEYHRLWVEIDTIFTSMIPREISIRTHQHIIDSMINKMLFSLVLSKLNPTLFILISTIVTRGIEKNGLLFYVR